ncbi:hypothetical protein ACFL59_02535, partial [Planctomycetota bacterium]
DTISMAQRWPASQSGGGVKRIFDYEVLGEGKIAGEPVFRIQATQREVKGAEDGSPEPTRILHYRLSSYTLVAWDVIPQDRPSLFKRHWNERGEAAFLYTGRDDRFFYDHPWIPPGRHDLTRELKATASLPALTDHYRFRGGGSRCEAEFRADVRNEYGALERLFSQQIWEAGRPYWTEAVRMLADRVLIKARLILEEE